MHGHSHHWLVKLALIAALTLPIFGGISHIDTFGPVVGPVHTATR